MHEIIMPDFVERIGKQLRDAGFEAYIVGGCVRDLLMGKSPSDWDMTTNARPDKLTELFPEGKYENKFGTVLIPIKNPEGATEDVVEITTYRSEHGYSDARHPDEVKFEDRIEKDLERRDFTINAMAYSLDDKREIVDLFGGYKDIKKRIVRAVGEPSDRFREDALRMLRTVRFAVQLDFEIEPKTERAIAKLAGSIKFVSNERIRDEFVKILSSDKPYDGLMLLYKLKLLQYILPELLAGEGVAQNHHHIYSVFKHNALSLKNCPSSKWQVRLASLLHDIGKPRVKKFIGGKATFYNHEYVSERMTGKIMKRLKFSSKDAERVTNLVRNHMFYYNVGEVTEASVRRLIKKVGRENLKDLIDMRIADRLGSGTPKGKPYKLRHLEYMMEKVQFDPVSVKMLNINGDELMMLLDIEPSPKVGAILDVLLAEVIEDPKLNDKTYLRERAVELNKLELNELRERAKEKIVSKQDEDDKRMKKKFWVK